MSSRFYCWLCPTRLPTKKELKSHLSSSEHRRLEVICPLCPDRRCLRRFWELKNHVNRTHPSQAKTLDDTFWKEPNGFWFAVHPRDYARMIEPPPSSSAGEIKARELMKKWLLNSTNRERLQDWERDWRRFGGLARESQNDPSLEEVHVYVLDENEVVPSSPVPKTAYDPQNPTLDYNFEVVAVNLQPSIEVWVRAGGHLHYKVTFQQEMLKDCRAIQALTRKAPSETVFQERPISDGLPVPITKAGPLIQHLGIDMKYVQHIFRWTAPVFRVNQATEQSTQQPKTDTREVAFRQFSPISEAGDAPTSLNHLQMSPNTSLTLVSNSMPSVVPSFSHPQTVQTKPGVILPPPDLPAVTPNHLPPLPAPLPPAQFPASPVDHQHHPSSLLFSAHQSPSSRVLSPNSMLSTSPNLTPKNPCLSPPPSNNACSAQRSTRKTVNASAFPTSSTTPITASSSNVNQLQTSPPSISDPSMLQTLKNNRQDEVIDLSKLVKPTTSQKLSNPPLDLTSQGTPAHEVSDCQGTSAKAGKLLRRGCMPLMPPARRDWTKAKPVNLKSGPINISWPPHDWEKMTPENKQLHWVHLATTLEMTVNGRLPTDHTDLYDRYNMFALPGMPVVKTKRADLPSEVSRKSRLYNYKLVAAIASGKQIPVSESNQKRLIDMLESASTSRDTSTDQFSALLDASDIPLRLEP